MSQRPYELVLLGATGYTGQLTAKYIQQHVAPDLVWAIAGRDAVRLSEIADGLQKLNPNRIQPTVEVTSINDEELLALVSKTKVLMTTLGPYAKFGEPVVKACVEAGTHYLDVTGEITFTYDMMSKYHEAAKTKGVCIIPQCAIDSIPSDILAYLCAKAAQESLHASLRDCAVSLQEVSGMLSGGTIHSLVGLFENYPSSYFKDSLKPSALSALDIPAAANNGNGLTLGSRYVSDLGALTESAQAMTDTGLVYRSWGLFDSGAFYGPNFSFAAYIRVPNRLIGTLVYYILQTCYLGLTLSLFRALVKRVASKPGVGPDHEKAGNDLLSYKAVAVVDEPDARRVYATYRFEGSIYYMTGITLTEAALVLSRGGDCLAKRLGGMVTPATLEMEYIERLRKAGIRLEWGLMDS